MKQLRVSVKGAAGNLGSLLKSEIIDNDVNMNLLIHNKNVSGDISSRDNVSIFWTDLADKESLHSSLTDVYVIVHFAEVLFKSNPEKFLPTTNLQYFENLLDVAVEQKVKRVILISFPHVEGESTPENSTRGSLDGSPISMHAKTPLEEEKLLFKYSSDYDFEPVSLRVGMVYGDGVLMIDAAQWFARYYLLGVWASPTYVHLISKDDFVSATLAAIVTTNIKGIYHIRDEGVQTLQEFLDDITTYKGYHKPWRMMMAAAREFKLFLSVFNTVNPLTVDFIKIGMVSYYGDTERMRKELLSDLKYKTYKEGIHTF